MSNQYEPGLVERLFTGKTLKGATARLAGLLLVGAFLVHGQIDAAERSISSGTAIEFNDPLYNNGSKSLAGLAIDAYLQARAADRLLSDTVTGHGKKLSAEIELPDGSTGQISVTSSHGKQSRIGEKLPDPSEAKTISIARTNGAGYSESLSFQRADDRPDEPWTVTKITGEPGNEESVQVILIQNGVSDSMTSYKRRGPENFGYVTDYNRQRVKRDYNDAVTSAALFFLDAAVVDLPRISITS